MRLIAAGGAGAFRPEIFLADAIENGAGFITRPRPVIDTGQGLIVIVHPLDHIDTHLVGEMPTAHGPAKVFDVFNFDRRPGELYRRLWLRPPG